MSTKRKRNKRAKVGGLKRKTKWTHNIVPASRRMKGGGPDHGGGGPMRSLPTHAVVRPGLPTGTFAVEK